jgi:cell division protein FtsI/penicillin-binding protein 2
MRNTRSLNKFAVLKLLFGIVFGVLALRLISIQVLSHDDFKKKAYSQQFSRKTIDNERGKIYSSDNYILATNSISYTLIMNPSVVKNLDEMLNRLSEKINFENQNDKTKFFQNNKNNFNPESKYLRLKKDLTRDEMEGIEKLNLIGISFEKEIERFYPESPLATSVLGFVASSEKRGYFGVEGRNDKLLRGREGLMLYERGADGEVILYGNYDKQDSINGDSLVLTIDRTVQFIIEKKLMEHISKTGANSGQIIVMDPQTGNILGMASYPSFDPYNPYGEFLDSEKKVKSELRNMAIYGVEPGSVVKPLTIATGLDLGVINQNYTYQDNGVLEISNKTVDNWDKKHHGTMDLRGLLEKSNNIGASLIALKIGDPNLKKYLKKYGFGRSTDIDLEGEQIGSINPGYTSDIDTASIGFGQGFTATPLQVLASYSVFINDGNLVKPKIIKKIIKPDNTEIIYPNLIEKNVIKKEVSDYLDDLLTKSMKANESKYFNLKNYHIAGKTGTAQIADIGGYAKNKTNTFFVGYMPTSKKFSMITRLEDPKTSPYAAETAVPLWMETATELLNFYNIPPDVTY